MPAGVIMMSLQKVIVADTASLPNTASRNFTGIMHRTPANYAGAGGGSRRVFKHFAWFEVGSSKIAFSRPAHQRVTQAVGQTYRKERLFKNEVRSHRQIGEND